MSTVARPWLIDVLTTDSLTLRRASKGLGSSGIEAHDYLRWTFTGLTGGPRPEFETLEAPIGAGRRVIAVGEASPQTCTIPSVPCQPPLCRNGSSPGMAKVSSLCVRYRTDGPPRGVHGIQLPIERWRNAFGLVAVSGVCWRRQRCFGHRANASDVAHALAAGTRFQIIPVT